MRRSLFIAVVSFGLMLSVLPTWAHHAFTAEFDPDKPVTLEGKVSKMEWVNPHAWIHLDVPDSNGKVETWMVETGSPNVLIRRGLNKNSLPIGTAIRVRGYQAKNGSKRANGGDVTFPDGRTVFLGSSGTGAPYDAGRK